MKKIFAILVLVSLLVGCSSTDDTLEEIKIEDIALNFMTDVSKNDYKKAFEDYEYTSEMLTIVSEKFLEESLWHALTSTYGTFIEIKGTSSNIQYQAYDIIPVKLEFETAIVEINIVFDANKLIAGINPGNVEVRKPTEMPESIQEISTEFGKEGWKLPATLTVPKDGSNLPIVVLVHGSGPNDRDETIGPNKVFRDIAWSLAEKGVASLRYDKRTFAHKDKLVNYLEDFTVYDETIEDAILALEHVKTIDNIDTSKIYIAGHSLGGMLIPRIAEKTQDAAGYIIMAGSVTPLEDLMVEQVKYIRELDGSLSDEDKSAIALYEAMRDNVKNVTENSDLKSSDLFGISSSYWLDLQGYNPAELAKVISKPLFIAQGTRDYQVPVREFEIWKNVLGDKKNIAYRLYDGLNHLFIKGEGTPNPQEYNVPGHVDDSFIEDIINWLEVN